ncbi:hypothetical protein M9H77_02492 [Catharanthus roseus]|uniref:Uncharacterized protein n=1 Tax=Catharanthus roseus TaxID=4058 RepID=A0ACC0C8Q8_CATRO|nr:hypothetical protein M9H77_02492 [Catharanthus roseus]
MDELKKARQMVEKTGKCQYLIPIQEKDVHIFWRKLEIGSDIPEEHDRDMESEMRDLTSLLQKISIGPISNVREVRRLIKGSNPSPRGRDRPPRSGRGRGRGRSSGRSSLSSVVNPDSLSMPFPFNNAFPGRMNYDLRHRMNVYEQLFGSVERVTELIMKTNWEEGSMPHEYWMDTLDHLYVIAKTFNLCVVFLAQSESTTVLPLVSNMDGTTGTIYIGLIEELQHFIQLQLVDGCPLPPL